LTSINPPVSDAPDAGILPFSIPLFDSPSPSKSEVSVPRATDHENAYNFEHKRRGLCIIINNVEFDRVLELNDRSGSDADATGLEKRFRNLDFEVRNYRNVRTRDMQNYLRDAARADHSNADCFVCCVLSHGDEGVIYGRDGTLKVDDLIAPFKPNALATSLAGKPKIFFIQACRGTKLDGGVEVPDGESGRGDESDGGILRRIPTEADFLVAYSVVPGYYSWRNSVRGSWFIQALCDVLERYGGGQNPLDLLSMMTRVCRRVAYEFESNVDNAIMSRKKQIPSIVSTLTKDIYFLPKNKSK
jgi:caspase 7